MKTQPVYGEGSRAHSSRTWFALLFLIASVTTVLAITTPGVQGSPASAVSTDTSACAPGVDLFGFSDALDKQSFDGTSVGGLSALTYDRRRDVYYGLVDNGPASTSEARFYTVRLPTKGGAPGEPQILDVTTLRDASGQPFTASTSTVRA